jgi:hypothetical protein
MFERRRIRAIVAVAMTILGLVAPSCVAAECTQLDRWPSFRAAARSAESIVVGEVVESFQDDSADEALWFRLRVDEVLRGRSESSIDFRKAVQSGLPLTICPGDSVLRVQIGDHIAMAFGARYPGVGGPVTAIAFLNRKPDSFLMPGMERLTLGQVHSVADLPATDTDPGTPPTPTAPAAPFILVLIGLLGGWLADRRIRTRPR